VDPRAEAEDVQRERLPAASGAGLPVRSRSRITHASWRADGERGPGGSDTPVASLGTCSAVTASILPRAKEEVGRQFFYAERPGGTSC